MKFTDAHLHLWDIESINYPWLADVPPLNRTFALSDFQQASSGIDLSAAIFVQCECEPESYLAEIAYVTNLANIDPRIKGIVSYFPLDQEEMENDLVALLKNKLIKGIRRLEEDPISLYDQSIFRKNVSKLKQHHLTFDLGVKAHQIRAAVDLVDAVPDNRYMLDHFGKPAIKKAEIIEWKAQMKALSQNPQVYCKLSGLTTEADWKNWKIYDLKPYVDIVLEYFGPNRLVFGSDWPVVTLGSNYKEWLDTALLLCEGLSDSDKQKIFQQNTLDFYAIPTL